jgi:TPR repeat protein
VSNRFAEWFFFKFALLILCAGGMVFLPINAIAGMNEAKAAADAGDYDAAYVEFKPLAEQGDPFAQYMLALMHMHGKGTERNSRMALQWFEKSAAQGFADSLFNLGVMYTQAVGVSKDFPKGVEFLKQAGEQGSGEAQLNLGIIYDTGDNLPQDFKQAAIWYEKAAAKGVVPAQFNLGSLYESGQGVKKSEVAAIALYTVAMYNGFPPSSAKLEALKSRMSASDIARGKALVVEMVKPTKLTLSQQMSGQPVVPRNLTNALRSAVEK